MDEASCKLYHDHHHIWYLVNTCFAGSRSPSIHSCHHLRQTAAVLAYTILHVTYVVATDCQFEDLSHLLLILLDSYDCYYANQHTRQNSH